jgi:succinyl-diaminopimelate desuccinylase
MPDPVVARIQQWLEEHEQELIQDTVEMLRIPSIEEEPEPNAPFGKENRRALDLALSLAEKYGMKTADIEGYIGYGEVGAGDPLVMALGHLDVVPVGPGWKHEPFGAEIDEGYIYARGAVDDKGPTMASFYAIRAIAACAPDLPVRFRQVFGCNEESGFKCVERYVQTEEPPTFGVAPDSGWPLYHAEKGIANLVVSVPLNQGEFQLLEVEGGQRPNIVIDSCRARIRVSGEARKHVTEKLQDAWDRNVQAEWDDDVLLVAATGKASHGSMPYLGDSAGIRLFRFLMELSPLSTAEYFGELFNSAHISGVGLGIHGRDDVSEDLTCNLGIVRTEGDRVVLTYNVRYPVTWNGDDLRQKCESHLSKLKSGWQLDSFSDSPSLYFPLEHPLVKIICEVYRDETGEEKEPGVMGGGTYARAIPNTVSIGTGWPGDGHAHETDERIKVDHLLKMAKIYAHILYRLGLEAAADRRS